MIGYYDEDELDDLRIEARAERQYRNRLARHPDPRDPHYPGPDEGEEDGEQPES